jgi:hypothetical protein
MRARLRSPANEAVYALCKALVEPVFGIPRQERGNRQFRIRGFQKANNEFTLATMAYDITRLNAIRTV